MDRSDFCLRAGAGSICPVRLHDTCNKLLMCSLVWKNCRGVPMWNWKGCRKLFGRHGRWFILYYIISLYHYQGCFKRLLLNFVVCLLGIQLIVWLLDILFNSSMMHSFSFCLDHTIARLVMLIWLHEMGTRDLIFCGFLLSSSWKKVAFSFVV